MSRPRNDNPSPEEGTRKLHQYSGGGITVRYERKKCIRAGECVKGLPLVFNPKQRRWISPENSDPASVALVIDKCPSGALTYEVDGEDKVLVAPAEQVAITCLTNGPVRIEGPVQVQLPDGTVQAKERVHLCRCGASENKPFCDGKHKSIGFEAD